MKPQKNSNSATFHFFFNLGTTISKAFDGTELKLGTKINNKSGLIAQKNGPTEVLSSSRKVRLSSN